MPVHMTELPVEHHPFKPFLPEGCRLLMLGSFPPASKRWCMEFYYPNFINDMWRIVGLIFFGDKQHFVDIEHKTFHINALVSFLTRCGIGLYDTACAIRRTRNSAADKDLEIVEETDLDALLDRIPTCRAVVTTGQKATDVFCQHFHITPQPAVGNYASFRYSTREMRLYRMPSSSRAYPMKVEKKAEKYRSMFKELYPEDIPNRHE